MWLLGKLKLHMWLTPGVCWTVLLYRVRADVSGTRGLNGDLRNENRRAGRWEEGRAKGKARSEAWRTAAPQPSAFLVRLRISFHLRSPSHWRILCRGNNRTDFPQKKVTPTNGMQEWSRGDQYPQTRYPSARPDPGFATSAPMSRHVPGRGQQGEVRARSETLREVLPL